MEPEAERNKNHLKTIEELFKHITEGNPRGALPLFSKDCKQHNPYVAGSMGDLFDSMSKVISEQKPQYPDPGFSIRYILNDGDLSVAYTNIMQSRSKPGAGGLRQAHLFRFDASDKIVEYWDITQQLTPEQPCPENAF